MTIGSTSSTCGPSRCTSARTGATSTRGGLPVRNRQSTRRRRPIVSSDGETRSNGSVSHAGKDSTSDAGRNRARSCASRSASAPVGTASRIGRRVVRPASAAVKTTRAASGTATTGAREITARSAGSSARSFDTPSSGGRVSVVVVVMSARQRRRHARVPGGYLLRVPAERSAVVAVHGGVDAVGDDHLDGVGGLLEGDVDLLTFALGEAAEHVIGAVLLR